MSTIHNIHGDMTAGTSALQPTDEIAIYEASTGLSKKLTGALVMGGTGGVVATTATTLALTQASHAGRTLVVSSAAPIAITTPEATGTGSKYRIFIAVAATGTAHTITAGSSDVMAGGLAVFDTSATDITAIAFAATATDKIISLNGTTKAGTVGTVVELEDVATNTWSVFVRGAATGSYATPFSSS